MLPVPAPAPVTAIRGMRLAASLHPVSRRKCESRLLEERERQCRRADPCQSLHSSRIRPLLSDTRTAIGNADIDPLPFGSESSFLGRPMPGKNSSRRSPTPSAPWKPPRRSTASPCRNPACRARSPSVSTARPPPRPRSRLRTGRRGSDERKDRRNATEASLGGEFVYCTAMVTVLDAMPPALTINGTALPEGALAGTCAFTW